MPRVLIADDDPVSLRFLAAAITQLGGEVVAVADGAGALAAAESVAFDLLLLDRRMPDVGGADLLSALRASGVTAPAIATSAEIDVLIDAELRRGGFADIVAKPATLAQLQRAVFPHLHFFATSPGTAPGRATACLLDDDAALAVIGGDAMALRALRGLLAQELAALESELRQRGFAQPDRLCERLHRLRASCGFCGAAALAVATAQLEHALRSDSAAGENLLSDFVHLCAQTAGALRA